MASYVNRSAKAGSAETLDGLGMALVHPAIHSLAHSGSEVGTIQWVPGRNGFHYQMSFGNSGLCSKVWSQGLSRKFLRNAVS